MGGFADLTAIPRTHQFSHSVFAELGSLWAGRGLGTRTLVGLKLESAHARIIYNFMDGIDGIASVEAITVCPEWGPPERSGGAGGAPVDRPSCPRVGDSRFFGVAVMRVRLRDGACAAPSVIG